MPSCKHFQWLEVCGKDPDWTIVDPGRLQSLENLLPDSSRQKPILMFFLGKWQKALVMKTVFPENNLSRRTWHGIANLFLDHSSSNNDNPWLIADCTLDASSMNSFGPWTGCHENRQLPMTRGGPEAGNSREEVVAGIQANLFLPLTHIVCVFAEDFGGNKACYDYIMRWLSARGPASGLRPVATPELIVVSGDLSTIDTFIQLECEADFSNVFESMTVVTVDRALSPALIAQKVRRILRDTAKVAQERRSESHLLLSAHHTKRVFHHGVQMFSSNPNRGIDILSSSDHPAAALSMALTTHLTAFLSHAERLLLPEAMASELVASALLKQAYPDFLHHFPPRLLYERFFAPVVSSLATESYRGSPFQDGVQADFERFFLQLTPKRPAAAIRTNHLKRVWTALRDLKSTTTCWECMVRAPEHILHSGHGLCDPCAVESNAAGKSVHTYSLRRCPICGYQQQFVLRMKPWTVEPNVLAIDGGGIKGIGALVLLKRLAAALGSNIGDYFHYSAGTSAGGLIILDHIVGAAPIDSSIERFKFLAHRIFPIKSYGRWPALWKIVDWLKWLLSDNKYDSSILEDVVQEVFGTHERLFDGRASREQSRIGIMATTASTSRLRIFTNYNGEARAEQGDGYAILRSEKATEEPFLWEVARCTTAAPGFFRPKQLKFFGKLQDGAMSANNPSAAAKVELRCVWPQTPKPHVLVSVGTGFSSHDPSELGAERGILWDGFISRVFRGFMSSTSVDGDSGWLSVIGGLSAEEKKRHFRLSFRFDGDAPTLDNASAMSGLEAQASICHQDYSELVRLLWASRFFMEFQSEPDFRLGEYLCQATIYFQGDDIRPFLEFMCQRYPFPQIKLGNRVLSRLYQHEGVCRTCGFFKLTVDFRVRHQEDSIALKLAYDSALAAPIQGDGQPVNWFLKRQRLYGVLRRWNPEPGCCEQRKSVNNEHALRRGRKRKAIEL